MVNILPASMHILRDFTCSESSSLSGGCKYVFVPTDKVPNIIITCKRCYIDTLIKEWPLFEFLDLILENETLGYNGGIFIT